MPEWRQKAMDRNCAGPGGKRRENEKNVFADFMKIYKMKTYGK